MTDQPKETYFAFCGSSYYPAGGANDHAGTCATLAEAVLLIANTSCDWWHIATLAEHGQFEIVAQGKRA